MYIRIVVLRKDLCGLLRRAVEMARKLQISIALDAGLRDRLEKLASDAGRSIADEIRQRIERTLEQDRLQPLVDAASKRGRSTAEEIEDRVKQTLKEEELFDASTRWLAAEIRLLARDVQRQTGHAWRAHPKSHEALVEAIATVLEQVKPRIVEGEDKWGSDDPRTLGRAVARSRRDVRDEWQSKVKHIHEEIDAIEARQEEIRAEDKVVKELMKVLTPKLRTVFTKRLPRAAPKKRK
jgi:predicted DNA-binding protein